LNRLRMEHRASLSRGRHELTVVDREIRKLIQAIRDGVSALSIKDELCKLEARKAELPSKLEAPEMPELLHPRMSDVYREKVGSLCLALEAEESRTGAAEAIRALVEVIVLEPDGERLKITARDSKRSPDTGDLLVQIKWLRGHATSGTCRCGAARRKSSAEGLRDWAYVRSLMSVAPRWQS
jgi:hypothetical protein